MLALDHLAVSCGRLDEGVAWVEALLGVALAAGGVHALMGTHNRLLGLGPGLYLEVIAIDRSAPNPGWPRWFDLDRFAGPPRLTHWICRTPDLTAALTRAGAGLGVPVALARGDFRWRFAIPANGRLPFDEAHPALIEWQGPNPASVLPDSGCRLERLQVMHPQAAALQAGLTGQLADDRVRFAGGAPGLRAEIATPRGRVVLA